MIAMPLCGFILMLFIPSRIFTHKVFKQISLLSTTLSLIPTAMLWSSYMRNTGNLISTKVLVSLDFFPFEFLVGLDGISLSLLLLTNLLIPLCILASWDYIKKYVKFYYLNFLMIQLFLIIIFISLDLLVFYIFFESILIPMFFVIGIWGSRERKIRASYMFFLYTLFGSLFMLFALAYIYVTCGSTNYFIVLTTCFDPVIEKFLWFAFFLAFATKVPMLPLHIWLPEAHVEAPTAGSVLLAGILLKLGTYGFMRFSIPIFPLATVYFTPLMYTLGVIAIVYTSLTAIRQTDLKRIIAYASVAHMNLIIVGMYSLTIQGLEGGFLQMLSHGLVSSGLFLLVGVLYDRHHSRLVSYYAGLTHVMPLFSILLLVFSMANIGLPGTSSFIGEFLIFVGVFEVNTITVFFSMLSLILGGGYSLWLYNRIAFGNLKTQYAEHYVDLSKREFTLFVPLVSLVLLMGVAPWIFLDPLHLNILTLIEQVYA